MKKRATGKDNGYPWWLKSLALLGAIALVGVITTLFFSFGRRPAAIRVTEYPSVDSSDFLLSVSGIADGPFRKGGTVTMLNNGDQIFPALVAAIRGAQKSVNFSVYIWEPGAASDMIVAALMDRAKAGVPVRVLLDGLGGMKAPEEQMDALRAAGAQVVTFRSPRLGKLTRFHKRNHRRSIVIDGVIGFTGGAAVADKWIGNADTEEHWRDTMYEVTGPMAATLQSAFAAEWAYAGNELLVGAQFFPPVAPDTSTILHTGVASSPGSENHPLRLLFLETFSSARQRLWITTPYFVPDQTLRDAVCARARAGVDVRILLPDEHTDAKAIRLTSHKYYQELLDAGVHVYEYQATMLHSKGVVVDGKWSVVGSANMDIRSLELNHENVLGILDPVLAQQLEAAFQGDLAKSQEIDKAQWERRGWFARLKERLAPALSEQY
jgi:cardiolipin synthase